MLYVEYNMSSDFFNALRINACSIQESNNSSSDASRDTTGNGLFIPPSEGVSGRPDDITGYILSAANEQGKLQWSSPDLVSLPASIESIGELTTGANQMLYTVGLDTYQLTPITAAGRSFVSLLTAPEQRQALGLEIGVDVQAYSQNLTDLNTIAATTNQIIYSTGGTYSSTLLTPFARTDLLTAVDASALASLLGYITQGGAFTSGRMIRTTGATEVTQTGITVDGSDNMGGILNLTTTGTLNGVTTTEMSQLANIDTTTISSTQWGYLGDLDQSLATTDTPTFSGLNVGSQKITNLLDPTNAQDATTKSYVDAIASSGAPPLTNADYATAAILPNSPVYASPAETLTSTGGPGSLTVDGQIVSVNDKILVKDQADPRENGEYDVTDDGASPGPNWVLTRSPDFNQAAMPVSAGTSIFVSIVSGASNSASSWALHDTVNNVDPLTDDVDWVQIGGNVTYTAGPGIDSAQLTGGTIQIENTAQFTYSGNALELSTVMVPYGGTGQTTLASGGVLVGQGVGAVSTSKAAPSGDFVGTTDTQVLTNKTATDPTNNINARGLFSNSGVNTVSVYAAANPSSGQVLTATGATTATWQTPSGGVTTHTNTLTVSPSNPDVSPNWTTVAGALADATSLTPSSTNQILIIIFPGTYSESTPLTIPSYVTLSGQVSTQTNVVIRPTAPAPVGAVFILSAQSRMYGLVVDGNDLSGGNTTLGISSTATGSSISYLNSVTVRNCSQSALYVAGDGTQYSTIIVAKNCSFLVTQPFPFSMTNGIEALSGAIVSGNDITISGFLSGGGFLTNAVVVKNDYTYFDMTNLGISSTTNGLVVGTGVSSNYASEYSIARVIGCTIGLVSGSSIKLDVKSNVFLSSLSIDDDTGIFPSQIPLEIINPALPAEPNYIKTSSILLRVDLVQFLGGATNNLPNFLGDFVNTLLTEPQTNILGNLSVGSPQQGYELVGGEGNSHIFGISSFIDDGGVFTDVVTAVKYLVTDEQIQADLSTTGAIDLASAPATVDGVAPTSGVSRILVKEGSTANPGTTSVDNGVYLWNGTGAAMTRVADFNTGDTFPNNTHFYVDAGDTNYRCIWKLFQNSITVGTTAFSLTAYSTPTWPNPPTNGDAFYVGSVAPLRFPGIKITLSKEIELSSGTISDAIVWEYWNGSIWAELSLMSTLSDSPYTPYQDQTFSYQNAIPSYSITSYQYRFGDLSDWGTTTVNGSLGYWIRARVVDASIITTVPVIDQVKLHTNRTEINADGYLEFFGIARPIKHMEFVARRGFITSYTNPGNERLEAYNDGTNAISFNFTDSQFNNGVESGMGWVFPTPYTLDTSFPIHIKIFFAQPDSTTGNVALRADYSQTGDGDILGPLGTPSGEFYTSGYQAFAVGGLTGQQTVAELTISAIKMKRDNMIWLQVRRGGAEGIDTYNNNIFILMVELDYHIWAVGAEG